MSSNNEQAQIHFERGNELHGAGHVIQAMDEWKTAVNLDPNYIDARLSLGAAFAEAGELDRAVEELDAAFRMDPYNKDVQDKLVEALNQRGTQASEEGNMARATEDWKHALDFDEGSADAHYNLGLTFVEQGDLESAEEHLRAAVQAEPYDLEIRQELAQVLIRMERGDDAVRELHEALDVASRLNQSLTTASSSVLPIEGQYDAEAFEKHAALLERASAHFDTIARTLADLQIQRGEFDDAQAALEQAQFDKDSAPSWLAIGRAGIDQGRIDDAVLALRRAYQCDKDLAEARSLLDQLGEPYEAPPDEQEEEAEEDQ